jgi:pyrimidine-nucleoside phosphorylase
MKTLDQARELARSLCDIGQDCGLNMHISITDMEQPLGWAVGNALEVKEAIRVLNGEPGRMREICLHFAGMALQATGKGDRTTAKNVLENGSALAKAREWFAAQGADVSVFDDESWCVSTAVHEVHAERDGFVSRVDARAIGQAVVDMGGGRKTKDDEIDPSVGIVLNVEVGDRVEQGQVLATLHGPAQDIGPAFEIVDHEVERRPVVIETL